MDLAIFDFDGTITTKGTYPGFVRFAVRPGRKLLGAIILSPLLVCYKCRLVSDRRIRSALSRVGFWRDDPNRLRRLGARYAEEADMKNFRVACIALVIGLSSSACILRPGMNADCTWPPEPPRRLDLTNDIDRHHLVVDTELVAELVDRYRFHVPNEQPACEKRLIDAVARTHSVSISDVASARERIPERGLDLPVNVPVAGFFMLAVLAVARRIERRFPDERFPAIVMLAIASVALTGLFVLVGEFWTSILQMIRVGSQHVGGRVARLPWKRHEPQIFIIGVVLFWIVVSLRQLVRQR